MRKLLALLCVGISFALVQASPSIAQVDKSRPLKIALVLPGPVSDGTFNTSAANGIKEAQAKYPNISVSIRENTSVAQSEAALFEYARNGYDVVIGHGFQFAEGAKKDSQAVSEHVVRCEHRKGRGGSESCILR